MPRIGRIRSQTGIYHVVLKGTDDRNIFLENEDRDKFIRQLLKAREKGNFSLLAYCLMDNHVHLLIEENEEIGKSIQRMAVGYVQWHNQKYGRKGHLFQNRFASEAVETDRYLLAVFRYIHQNPVKAGMVHMPSEYSWSSYQDYLAAFNRKACFIDGARIMAYFETQETFEEFINALQNDQCIDYNELIRYTDSELRRLLLQEFSEVEFIESMSTEERKRLIKEIYGSTNASIRQLGRVLKLGRGVVERAIR